MPTYTILDDGKYSPGFLRENGRLEFGALTVVYNERKNKFYLSSPHNPAIEFTLCEADIPAFLIFALRCFKPFDGRIACETSVTTDSYERLFKASVLFNYILDDVRNWTSKHCIDCVSQRDRVDQARRVLDLILTDSSNGQTVDLRQMNPLLPHLIKEARGLSDAIQGFVETRRAEHRKKGIN